MVLLLALLACRLPPERRDFDADGVVAADDCDDNRPHVYPGAPERCDGRDEDCDGEVDEDATDALVWAADGDHDGFGDPSATVRACAQPPGTVSDATDCDDTDGSAFPGAPEEACDDPVDRNCDGEVGYTDADGDGWAACADCDDASADRSPDVAEVCNGLDDDCDGAIDEAGSEGELPWYPDEDGDGFGTVQDAVRACARPAGYAADATDCDDRSAAARPGGQEVCDGLDNDCDGVVDEPDAPGARDFFADGDKDGFGNSAVRVRACAAPPGFVEDAHDCDDADATAWPGAPEQCDEVDDDCDGDVDEGFDLDGDGATSCSGDCDDADPTVREGAAETCDGRDEDCDGDIDESVEDPPIWYVDYDADGYGSDRIAVRLCDAPAGFADNPDDCDDLDPDTSPAAAPVCDGRDRDCDGRVDHDADKDGYADAACGGDDCDDADPELFPEPGGGCALGASCREVMGTRWDVGDGVYTLDPDGALGEPPLEAWCDMTSGFTLCAALTKGYVPAHALYAMDAYAFQARLNGDRDFVFEREAPAREDATWEASETLNYGAFCRLFGGDVEQTKVEAKLWNGTDSNGAQAKGAPYDLEKSGIFSGNLFVDWFTNKTAARTFTYVSGDRLYVQNDNNKLGGPYATPSVGWAACNQCAPYTQSTNPWNNVDITVACSGCTARSADHRRLPYGQTTYLNDLGHAFWGGIPNPRYGWSDCTANNNCDLEESGLGVWLFWVR